MRVSGATMDPSVSQKTERLEREDAFRLVMESANDFLLIVGAAGEIYFVNRVVIGTEAEVYQKTVYDFLDPRSHEKTRSAIAESIATGERTSFESVGQGPGGRLASYFTRIVPLRDQGSVPKVALIATDISSLREKEAALAESEEKLKLSLSASGMGLWSYDPATDRVEWDDNMHAIFGLQPGQGPKRLADYGPLVHPDDRADIARVSGDLTDRPNQSSHEYRIIRPDGQVRWLLIRSRRVPDPTTGAIKFLGGTLDVTDRRAAEDLLRQAQRSEIIGHLAASVAHNFNNQLMAIFPNLELAKHHPDRAATFLEAARKGAQGAADLVRELLTFAGKIDTYARAPEELAPILEEVVSLARSSFPAHTEIILRMGETSPVLASAVQLQQVFLNLLLNARDALHDVASPKLEVTLESSPTMVCVRVRDNGCGMDESTRARLFEPFFTTKSPGKGTGLGLASALGIVRDHGGTISCTSSPGKGAEFLIEFPPSQQPSRPPPEVESAPAPRSESPTRVLLVDDVASVLLSTAMVLRANGLEVVEASSAKAALERFVAAPTDFDVVITDVTMPEMSGPELLTQLRALRSDVCLILLSGLPVDDLGAADGSIVKPVAGATLAARVEAFRARRANESFSAD